MAISIQVIGFQCVVEENVDGKKKEKKVGRVYQAKSACDELAELYRKSGMKAWTTEIRKVEDLGK